MWFHLSHRSSVSTVLCPSQSFLCGSIFHTDVSASRVLCPSQSLLCSSIFHKHASCKLFLGYFILPSVCCVVPSFALMCHSTRVQYPSQSVLYGSIFYTYVSLGYSFLPVWFHLSRRCRSQVSLAVVLDLSQTCLCHSISCKCLVGLLDSSQTWLCDSISCTCLVG